MMGASALQSAHQCAQKNSSTGDPLSCAGQRQFRAQELIRLQRRRQLPLERQQVQILLQPVVNGSCSVSPQRGLQQRDRLRPLPAGGQYLRLNFQRRAQRDRQVRIGIQRTLLQLLQRQRLESAWHTPPPDRIVLDPERRVPSTNRRRDIRR